MTTEIQSSADAATRVAAIQREWEGVTERVLRDAGVTRAALVSVGACLMVGSTSRRGALALEAEARDLSQRFGLPPLDLPLVDRVTRTELETYMQAFLPLLRQPPDASAWEALVKQYDEKENQ